MGKKEKINDKDILAYLKNRSKELDTLRRNRVRDLESLKNKARDYQQMNKIQKDIEEYEDKIQGLIDMHEAMIDRQKQIVYFGGFNGLLQAAEQGMRQQGLFDEFTEKSKN